MLKNVKHYLSEESGTEIFGEISLIIFFLFFAGLLYYVYTLQKCSVDEMKNLPLEDGEYDTNYIKDIK
jgi:cytochrome c oxidase cbb3-type subunit 3